MYTLVVWFVVFNKLIVVPGLDGIQCVAEAYEFRNADAVFCIREDYDV